MLLSILLLTISSGLLFYKNLYLKDSESFSGKVDFEELRYTDLQINATVALLKSNLNVDSSELEREVIRLNELLNIVTDINKATPELNDSIVKIRAYFDRKIVDLNNFQTALKELKRALEALNPAYNELNRNKIKFTLDNRDFYRECVVDALSYVAMPSASNETRLLEDKKILGQVINFARTPNPHIQKFSAFIDIILKRTKEIALLTERFNNDNSVDNELKIVGKYYTESLAAKDREAELFLSMIFGAIILYLIAMVVVVRKLT